MAGLEKVVGGNENGRVEVFFIAAVSTRFTFCHQYAILVLLFAGKSGHQT